uniref:Gustatory receptor n=1 Tax=Caenorhabditis japonica TaxID=281687 RepID=A0A8R1HT98_CAEJA
MKTCEVQQMEELVDGTNDKFNNIDLLGIFRHTAKLTGLDCTACAAAKTGNGSKVLGAISQILSIAVIILMFVRAFTFLGEEGKILSFNWAESNVFGFMGLHCVVCCFCVMGWTAHSFVPNYLKQLGQVRILRVEPNEEIDDYRGLRKKAFILSLPWLGVMMFTALFNSLSEKILWSGAVVPSYKYSIFPALAFLVWLITSTCLTFYALVQFSMTREIEYFNDELQKASEDKKLKEANVFSEFSFRQKELFKLVVKTNESLSSYARIAPLFCFFSIINIIYSLSFFTHVPLPYAISLIALLLNILGWTVLTLIPACKVQHQLTTTAKILMESNEFESAEPKVFQTYRVMVDRSLKNDTRIFVLNAFGIDTTNFNVAMFAIPNLGPILMMLKKVLEANGVSVS